MKRHGLRRLLMIAVTAALAYPASPAYASQAMPAYLTSATYFSDDWPISFWNSESRHMDEEMARIAADGFNSIILVIPWREFQPDMTAPTAFTPYAADKLDRLMETAGKHGLGVMVRIGYTWDYYETESPLYRYEDLLSSSKVKQAWLTYARILYKQLSVYDNFYGGFITWEDFWNFTQNSLGMERTQGKKKASACGYTSYLKEHYTLPELSKWYQEKLTSYSQIYIPSAQQPAAALFYEFYDDFLNKLLDDTQAVFPDLSMEARMDREPLYDLDGNLYYYEHDATYSSGSAPYTSTMTSVAMGQRNEHELVSAASGIGALTAQLDSVSRKIGGKKIYIDQFLYMDTTQEYSHNAQVLPEQLPSYITGIAPAFRQYSKGYGVWVYQDYGNNQLYNAQFAIGSSGWSMEKGITVKVYDNTPMALLTPNLTLRQSFRGTMRNRSHTDATVSFRAVTAAPCELDIYLGFKRKSVVLEGDHTYTINFDDVSAGNISFITDGTVYLDDIDLYTFIQKARLYDIDGNPQDCVEAIRQLNESLK